MELSTFGAIIFNDQNVACNCVQ